ncbi:MAG TPA: LysM peptidoglycan-binding domain-containing protein [Anaerolineae bacterium]|nr:LysM peptidoglycan-binding domain-containing protein [Anaerolineae bacterium]HQK14547.1 LysM peptidoglycan-binding domain-containing protein [Anaerolineae bacterium]
MRRKFPVLLLVLGLLWFSSVPVYAQPAAGGIIVTHVVKPGETIYCIARAYGVDPNAIIKANPVPYPNWIYPGQKLDIPNEPALLPPGPVCARQDVPAPQPCTCAKYHTVVTGENLYRISLKYGVSMWRIAECNRIQNLNYIRVADVLCIPSQ